MRARLLTAIVLLFAVTARSDFQYQRTITPAGPGPNRLDADVTLLAGSAPDLPDLRLFDGSGREVPYLVIQPPNRERRWTGSALLDVATTKTTSGFEADLGALREIDRLRLNSIRAPYLKQVTLEASGDRSHWTLLADTTVFDLPDQNLRRAEVAFDPGSYRYLRVTWNDRNSARVTRPASVEARLYEALAPAEPVRANLPMRKLSSEPGKSRYRLDLPGPHLPVDAIEVNGGGGDVFRNATITEPQLTNGAIVPSTLGSALLRRAVRNGFIASETAIPIAPPSGRELELVIDDASNPPIPDLTATARFSPQPCIYFEAASAAPLVARYGDDRLAAPHYDLEAARQYVGRDPVRAAHWNNDAAAVTGKTQQNNGTPLPAFGPVIDRSGFRVSRPLQNAERGLVVLSIDADVLSVSHNLADVRIVDKETRQVPYVVEHRDEPLTIRLKVPSHSESPNGVSRYHLELPYATLPGGTRLVLTTSARVFERSVRIVRSADEQRGREEIELAGADWRNTTPERSAAPLTFDVPLYNVHSIDIVINEGDNAPLPITSAELLLPSFALRFNHPGGALAIIYGRSDASAPRYDLALLAPRLLTEPAHSISIAKPQTTGDETGNGQAKYFWIIIAAAAIVLLVLLVRLLGSALKEPGSLGETPRSGDAPR
jgi:Protein of unknown function (DUF3999)